MLHNKWRALKGGDRGWVTIFSEMSLFLGFHLIDFFFIFHLQLLFVVVLAVGDTESWPKFFTLDLRNVNVLSRRNRSNI